MFYILGIICVRTIKHLIYGELYCCTLVRVMYVTLMDVDINVYAAGMYDYAWHNVCLIFHQRSLSVIYMRDISMYNIVSLAKFVA